MKDTSTWRIHRAWDFAFDDFVSPMNPPSGCVFHPRCEIAVDGCPKAFPEFREVKSEHWVHCTEV
jgi:oligopeptide/dipeptide ABC transporter ATP-binding protein